MPRKLKPYIKLKLKLTQMPIETLACSSEKEDVYEKGPGDMPTCSKKFVDTPLAQKGVPVSVLWGGA